MFRTVGNRDMNPLAALFDQLRQFFVMRKVRGGQTGSPPATGRHLHDDQARINRLMMIKMGWTLSFLMFLASFAEDGGHLMLFERLLNTCSLADTFLAFLLRDRWSATGLSRWDEAILFATISMGLRLFA